ncbi:ThiF family adenylyltransferase [Salegentibacter sp. JZCK2]|uniref:HesA/MoeB/ThiF family protein n=1 Tax=Salegentibacter tibetensis TaxID=2873600 RepID=UPI001CC91C14|nr:ThiF family adenylyltransferase [Salegentibacter tibetensis]MBZ9731183.1 ThiF family adenylyltransferase [Salegentibacter tibetensis]
MFRFRMTEKQHSKLKSHLHNGDGLEAVAFGLCGTLNHNDDNFLMLNKVFLLPYKDCERAVEYVNWKFSDIEHLIDEAKDQNLSVVKFHSHPFGNSDFSDLDDDSDTRFFESVYNWLDNGLLHSSLIMYSDGSFKGRIVSPELDFKPLASMSIIGDKFSKTDYTNNSFDTEYISMMDRNKQAFGEETVYRLKNMKVAVIGCSGTGSPTIEQLVRLGAGELVLVDPDVGDVVNLNRILGLTLRDAKLKKSKVGIIKAHIDEIGLGTKVIAFNSYLQSSKEVINEVASSDFAFGCTDSSEGRHAMNLIGHYYLVPFIDIGVKLNADGVGGIDSIAGNIHYVFPGSKSLLERKVISPARMEEEELKRTSPEEYEDRQAYFENANVVSPAVISVNMVHSSLAVLEMLDRIHPFRFNDPSEYEVTRVDITDWSIEEEKLGFTESKFFPETNLGSGVNGDVQLYD